MSNRPGYRDTSLNWEDPTADAVLGGADTTSPPASVTVKDLQYLTPRMREVLTVLAETRSATRTANIVGISRDRVYKIKARAAQRILRAKAKAEAQ